MTVAGLRERMEELQAATQVAAAQVRRARSTLCFAERRLARIEAERYELLRLMGRVPDSLSGLAPQERRAVIREYFRAHTVQEG